jgi:hypothetical protein
MLSSRTQLRQKPQGRSFSTLQAIMQALQSKQRLVLITMASLTFFFALMMLLPAELQTVLFRP